MLWSHAAPDPVPNRLTYQGSHQKSNTLSADSGANDVADKVSDLCSPDGRSNLAADACTDSRAHRASKPAADNAANTVSDGRPHAASINLSVSAANGIAITEPHSVAHGAAIRSSLHKPLRFANQAAN